MFYDFITNYTDIFCWKKWEKLLHCKSFSHFFNKKYWCIWDINIWNFNEMLINNIVSSEQSGPFLIKNEHLFTIYKILINVCRHTFQFFCLSRETTFMIPCCFLGRWNSSKKGSTLKRIALKGANSFHKKLFPLIREANTIMTIAFPKVSYLP